MMRISVPFSSRCVAKEWRRVWIVTRFWIPARRTASRQARWREVVDRWWAGGPGGERKKPGRGARRETGNAAAGRRANSGAALPADAATTWHSGLFAPCLVRLEAAYGGSRYRPL